MIIGIDIGGTNIKGVLLASTRRGGIKVIAKNKIFTKSKTNKKIIIGRIFECIEALTDRAGGRVDKIGIGVAGPLDSKREKVFPPNVTGLKNTYLARIVQQKFKTKAVLENDVNCLVLAEAVLGAAKNKKMVVGLGLGTGVGGGIVFDKRIFHGVDGSAGEIGHMIIACPDFIRGDNGRLCSCGSKGCLEVYTNEKGIRKSAKEVFGKEIDSITLHKMAKEGNERAIKVWQITGRYLGIGLANLVNILNPDILIIGGGIAGAGKFLLEPAIKEMKRNILSPLAKDTKVTGAKLGEYAGAIGAGLLHF